MTDKNKTRFKSSMVWKVAVCCGVLLLIVIGCGIKKQITYDRAIKKELHDITEKTGWYVEEFDIETLSSKLEENYTLQDYKAGKAFFRVTVNITPSAGDPNLSESLYRYLIDLHNMGYQHICLSMKDDLIGQVLLFNSEDPRPYLRNFEDKEGFVNRVDRALKTCGCDCGSYSRNQDTPH